MSLKANFRSATARFTRRGYRLTPLVVFVLIYFAVLVYPPLRMLGLAFPGWQPDTPALAAFMAGPAAGRLLCEWLPDALSRFASAVVMTWLGTSFIGFCLVLPWELVALAIPLPDRASGLALLSATGALSLAAFVNAHWLHLRRVPIPAPADVPAAKGLTLVQITDVHVGSRSGALLRRAVRTANRAGPDYVLITGDLVDFRNMGDRLVCLAELEAPAFFIIGNHERYVDCEAICARLEALGVAVLRNRTVRAGPLQLIGIDDAEPKNQVSRILETLTPDANACRVLLYHRPDGVRDAARWGAHLMLCGHTHNGQLVPFNYVVKRVFPRIHGHYHIDGMHLYVSPGTGTWGPVLRLGSRCEVTAIRLV